MTRIKTVERNKGNLSELIPKMVNERGQVATAKALGLSPATINLWLKRNGYVKRIQYVKEQA